MSAAKQSARYRCLSRGGVLLAACTIGFSNAPGTSATMPLGALPYSDAVLEFETVVRVEEDWELVLNEPQDSLNSPQFHTAMSTSGDLNSYYGQIIWNHWEEPRYAPGGLQLQGWDGDVMSRDRGFDLGLLSATAETVTWTQSLDVDSPFNTLYFGVSSGQSSTWGSFGGSEVRIGKHWEATDLNGYRTNVSVENSCITYGANRVTSMRVLQVRRYTASGVVYVDDAAYVAYESQSGGSN